MAAMRSAIVNIGWAGGWDEYEIDLNDSRQATPEEVREQSVRVALGHGGNPVIGTGHAGSWLYGYFISGGDQARLDVNHFGRRHDQPPDPTLYKIIRHIRGGD